MKTLLILNGPDGWQTGIEDGFTYLHETGEIEELKWIYYESLIKLVGARETWKKVLDTTIAFQAELIVIFHISKYFIEEAFLVSLRNLPWKPILVYDEHDMYGSWAKPFTQSMIKVMRQAHIVSICGLGDFRKIVKRYNVRIIYTPHHADIARFDKEPHLLSERNNKLVLIGNKIKPRFLSSIRRMPGAKQREDFVHLMGKEFPKDFVLYGKGWGGLLGDRGPLDFFEQINVYRDTWITVAYEHYPKVPYYFSNRLPIALLSGSLYVCHYHEGYEYIFKNCDFIFFFKKSNESIDIVKYLLSLSQSDLYERSCRARDFALKYFHPNVIWKNFLGNIMNILDSPA